MRTVNDQSHVTFAKNRSISTGPAMATLAPSPPAPSDTSSTSAAGTGAASLPPSPTVPQVRRWTVDEFEAMIDAGIFHPDERLELIHGTLLAMAPQQARHAQSAALVYEVLFQNCPDDHHVRSQSPLRLGPDDRPEPDVFLVAGSAASVRELPSFSPLVVEIADSSLTYDRSTKADLYARHGLPEYWIVDLQHRTVEVYTDPGPDVYRTKRTVEPGDTITLGCAPDAALGVEALLPTPTDAEHDVEDDAPGHD